MKYKIAFIGTPGNPIPAYRGGAIQTLITALLDENEKYDRFEFFVYTRYWDDFDRNIEKYKKSHFYPIKISLFAKLKLNFRRILRRITNNHISYKSDYMKEINKSLLKGNYDFIIFETTDKEVVQLDSRIKSKVFFHIHSDYINEKTDRIDLIASKCDGFIAISDFIKSRLSSVSSLSSSKILVLKNSINIYKHSENDFVNVRSKIRNKYGFSDDEIIAVYCGRLSPEKGCKELIEAINLIDNCSLIVIGGSGFSDNRETKYTKELLRLSKQKHKHIVFTGYIAHSETWEIISSCDIGIVPSICNEAASLSALEFRSFNLPVIATNIGGIFEFCSPHSSIRVNLDQNFVSNLALSISQLAENDYLRKEMSQNSCVGINEFSYESYYERFSNLIYNELNNDKK